MTDTGERFSEERRVTGFSAPLSFDIGDIAAKLAAQRMDPEKTYTHEEIRDLVRSAGNAAAVAFFEEVGSGEIDLHTGLPGEVIRFTADAEQSVLAEEGSRWIWLTQDS